MFVCTVYLCSCEENVQGFYNILRVTMTHRYSVVFSGPQLMYTQKIAIEKYKSVHILDGVTRFGVGMAFVNLLLRPITCYFLYRVWQDRAGSYGNFGLPSGFDRILGMSLAIDRAKFGIGSHSTS